MSNDNDASVYPFCCDDDERQDKETRDDGLLVKLLKTRAVILSDPIDARLTKSVLTQLLLLDADDADAPIKVFINSPGGSADSGFAIYDMIRFIRPPVKTVCAGLVASAAAIILLAADKQNRLALPNARILLHQPSMSFQGCASDIEITAKEILRLKQRANRIISDATGIPVEQVVEDTNRDRWLSPEEAIAYGVVSRIVTRFDEV